MTPEELDEARVKEAERRWNSNDPPIPDIATGAARLAREGWTPPEPVVDPDILAWREWMANRVPTVSHWYLSGSYDAEPSATAYLAGARMAREQERERAEVLLRGLEDIVDADQDEISHMARVALAKYRGEA